MDGPILLVLVRAHSKYFINSIFQNIKIIYRIINQNYAHCRDGFVMVTSPFSKYYKNKSLFNSYFVNSSAEFIWLK